jgi:hypothetical protein
MELQITPSLVKNKNQKCREDAWPFLHENSGCIAIVKMAEALISFQTVYIAVCETRPYAPPECQKVLVLGRSPIGGDIRICGEEDNPLGVGSSLLFHMGEETDLSNISLWEFGELCATLSLGLSGKMFVWLDAQEYKRVMNLNSKGR